MQPELYQMPAPWGGVEILAEGGVPARIRPTLKVVAKPSPAPEAVADIMARLEEALCEPRATERELRELLFALPAFRRLPEFSRRVLVVVSEIEPAHWTSYAEAARAAGCERAARAVGQALAHNPFPILIGCHRVCGTSERAAFDILNPETFRPQAYLGDSELAAAAQWLRLLDLSF